MRRSVILATLVLATVSFVPAQSAEAQFGVIPTQKQAPPPVVLWSYSPAVHGPWLTSYPGWTPTTIYYWKGKYYRTPVPESRPLVVYSRGGDFFTPPRDRGWAGIDKRFDRSKGPNWRDRGRAKHHGNN